SRRPVPAGRAIPRPAAAGAALPASGLSRAASAWLSGISTAAADAPTGDAAAGHAAADDAGRRAAAAGGTPGATPPGTELFGAAHGDSEETPGDPRVPAAGGRAHAGAGRAGAPQGSPKGRSRVIAGEPGRPGTS